MKHDGVSVMVWGCFGYARVGKIVKIEGIMKKEQYHNILQRHAVPSGTELIDCNFVFQQDNDPRNTSHYCTNYLQQKQRDGVLQILKWPPQSPDLNPTELLWDELDRRVRDLKPTNLNSLWDYIKDAWNNMKSQTLQKHVEKKPKICAEVIKAKGDQFQENRLK